MTKQPFISYKPTITLQQLSHACPRAGRASYACPWAGRASHACPRAGRAFLTTKATASSSSNMSCHPMLSLIAGIRPPPTSSSDHGAHGTPDPLPPPSPYPEATAVGIESWMTQAGGPGVYGVYSDDGVLQVTSCGREHAGEGFHRTLCTCRGRLSSDVMHTPTPQS